MNSIHRPMLMSQPTPLRRQIDLSTCAWQFGAVPQQPWPAGAAGHAAVDIDRVDTWQPGTVPGTVQSDLLALDSIPDPFLAGNTSACRWVEHSDWWYRTVLPLDLDPGQRALIEFDGIDTLSAIFVAGRELRRHEGMFSRQMVEIPADVAARSSAELAVRLWGSAALPRYEMTAAERVWGRVAGIAQKGFRPFDDRLATLKAPMHAGWDFAPRLRTMGIWDDARLVVCREVFLVDLQVRAKPLATSADSAPARVGIRLVLDCDRPRVLTGSAIVRPANFTGGTEQRFDFALDAPGGRSRHEVGFDLQGMRLWQPWERGEPCLYELAVSLAEPGREYGRSAAGSPLDTISVRFGVRAIEQQHTGGGAPWRFVVNGKPLFLRGANWVPVDALWGRARRPHYEPLLQQARQAGVNFLRVWGGGGREKRAFYDLCDELGLLVWQEFPIACVFLDRLPRDERFQRLLHQEAAGIVQAVRNHPCIFLWCAGNEFSPSRNKHAVAAIEQVVAAEDGTRPFVAASPGPGDSHQWQVWHGLAPLSAYRHERAAFVSEFGLQAAPQVSSLRRFLSEADLWPPGPGWKGHKADLTKLWRYARWFEGGEGDITANGSDGRTDARIDAVLENFVAATQRAQAVGVQVLVEHVRRRKGQTGGLAVWQWNEPWPAISWSIVDYFGGPKQAYETLLHVFQPVLVSLEYALRAYGPGDLLRGMLWIVNDRVDDLAGCELVARLDGAPVHRQACVAPANAASTVGELVVALPAGFAQLRLELWQGDSLLAANVYDLRYHDPSPQRIDRALRRRMVEVILK